MRTPTKKMPASGCDPRSGQGDELNLMMALVVQRIGGESKAPPAISNLDDGDDEQHQPR
jgi:hypothetical protein